MTFEVYAARRGLLLRKQWRWRLKAANHRVIAHSGKGYNNKADCVAGIELVLNEAAYAPVKVVE